jgi:DNA polymerase elongation subunit (family B)
MYGQPCKKVRRWSKSDEESGLIYEGDIMPEMRYLVDNYTEYESIPQSHVEMFIDIEVDATNGLPNIRQADNKITAIAYYDKVSKEYIALILDESNEIGNQDYDSMHGEKIHVFSFSDEQTLLEKFMDDFIKMRPTILTGWNIDNFDVPYLYNRMSKLFGSPFADQLSPVNIVHWNDRRSRYFIAGVSCLDYMQLYKKLRAGERISYSLDSIGQLEVKMGKIKYDGTLDKLYREDKEKFIEYNVHDVRIVVAIDEKLKFIELAKGVCHKGHVPYEDIYFSSRWLDGAMLTYMKLRGQAAPNRPAYEQHHEEEDGDDDDAPTFSGAYVKEPIPGKYEWVVDLDAQSLYPSIIMTLNISPETKVTKVEGWNNLEFKNNTPAQYKIDLVDKILTLDNEKMRKFLTETGFTIASNGVLYDLKTPGIIPEILSKWFDERLEYKALMKKYGKENDKEKYNYYYMRQYIQKIILNSFYGVLGLPSFRFYDIDNASAVTTTGVDLIKFTQKVINFYYAQELGEQKDYVIYIDTDSCFFSVKPIVLKRFPDLDWTDTNAVSSAILSVTKDVQEFVNKKMDYLAQNFLNVFHKHRFYLKQELVAKAGFWTTKKRYALSIVNKEGMPVDELEVKGLDVVRTSFPKVFKDFMIQMLKDILGDVPKEEIDAKILDLKSKMWSYTISDLARPTGVKHISKFWTGKEQVFHGTGKGAPAHVKAAINYNDFIRYNHLERKYALINNGEKIKWVYLKDLNPLKLDGLAFRDNGEDPPEVLEYINKYIDLEKVFEKELVHKLTDFYDALKWGVIPTNVSPNFSKFF